MAMDLKYVRHRMVECNLLKMMYLGPAALSQGNPVMRSNCVCCCYNGTSGFVDMQPSADCTCKNNIKSSDVKIGISLAVIVVVPTLLAGSYFSGLLWISPYKKIR